MGKGTLQYHYNSFFYMHKVAACCQVYKVRVKPKLQLPFLWYHYILNKANLNPLNAELNLICHLLALLGAHHIFHVSRIMVNPHCCKNLNSCTSETLPVYAV